ncbi:MAG: hypothetical protein PHW04_14725 [Candidatus Wallbacteria bacterium]|nr:hypothetical protein [Candidatus Wallbacteria bacterium]
MSIRRGICVFLILAVTLGMLPVPGVTTPAYAAGIIDFLAWGTQLAADILKIIPGCALAANICQIVANALKNFPKGAFGRACCKINSSQQGNFQALNDKARSTNALTKVENASLSQYYNLIEIFAEKDSETIALGAAKDYNQLNSLVEQTARVVNLKGDELLKNVASIQSAIQPKQAEAVAASFKNITNQIQSCCSNSGCDLNKLASQIISEASTAVNNQINPLSIIKPATTLVTATNGTFINSSFNSAKELSISNQEKNLTQLEAKYRDTLGSGVNEDSLAQLRTQIVDAKNNICKAKYL